MLNNLNENREMVLYVHKLISLDDYASVGISERLNSIPVIESEFIEVNKWMLAYLYSDGRIEIIKCGVYPARCRTV